MATHSSILALENSHGQRSLGRLQLMGWQSDTRAIKHSREQHMYTYIYIYMHAHTHRYTHTHTHIPILFQIIFPLKLLYNIKQSSLCYMVGPCCLSILNIAVCICQSPNPWLPLPHPCFLSDNHKFIFEVWGSISYISSFILFLF